MESIFIELALMLLIAFIVSYIIRSFNQPIIIGYIIAGMIISPFIIQFGASTELINTFSEFGIAFLLFMVGLHLNPKVIKEIGTQSLLIGLGQIILTFGLSYFVSSVLLGYGAITSVYIGIAISFSSTIIVMKLISDKRQLDSLYGKISTGVLIVQDFVAIFALMFISSLSGGIENIGSFALKSLISGGALIIILFLLGFFVMPKVTRSVAKSQELLFLFSIAWAFVVSAAFIKIGFSLEIGALIAGMVLSISSYSTEISARIRPLRDFFLIIFFIILGLNVQISNISSVILPALIFSALALIFKPLVLMILTMLFGYTKRTNFAVGTTLAQISEFSLIVLGLGVAVGHIQPEILYAMTLTAIITITLSTYMTIYSNSFYKVLSKPASLFELKKIKSQKRQHKKYDAILFGYNRIGFSILNSLKRIKKSYLVVDFNPDTVADLNKMRVPSLYGDAYDTDLLNELPLEKVELIVSTIPDFETSQLLVENIRAINSKAIVIMRAHTIKDALELYKRGASYVLTPHFLGGEYVARMIKDEKLSIKGYNEEKEKHIKMLTQRIEKGHEHPEVNSD